MKIKTVILVALALITVVFLFTPYKFYTAVLFWITPNCSSNIAENFSYFFDGGFIFAFIFLPIVLALEILFSKNLSSRKWRTIFAFQGIVGILATCGMYFLMEFDLFESDVRLTPIFYISLLFVLTSSIGSVLMSIGRINNFVITRILTSRP